MIKKQGSKYVVKDSEGKKTLGSHSTRKKALAQLRAIEASKAERGYADGGTMSNTAESLAPTLKNSYADEDKKKKARMEAIRNFADGGTSKDRMKCNTPTRSEKPDKKFKVKGCQDGKERLIHYGDANMRIKKSNPERRKSFRARHKCETAKDKLSARYWSCKKW